MRGKGTDSSQQWDQSLYSQDQSVSLLAPPAVHQYLGREGTLCDCVKIMITSKLSINKQSYDHI